MKKVTETLGCREPRQCLQSPRTGKAKAAPHPPPVYRNHRGQRNTLNDATGSDQHI